MKTIVKENTWLRGFNHGWGNGYVIIPKGHKLHGIDYDDIEVDVHGGLTFGECAEGLDWPEIPEELKTGWVVGFDTCHFSDNQNNWTKEMVNAETERLRDQLINLAF